MASAVEHQDCVATIVEHSRLSQKLEAICAQAMHRNHSDIGGCGRHKPAPQRLSVLGSKADVLIRETESSLGVDVDDAVLVARSSRDDLTGAIVSRAHDEHLEQCEADQRDEQNALYPFHSSDGLVPNHRVNLIFCKGTDVGTDSLGPNVGFDFALVQTQRFLYRAPARSSTEDNWADFDGRYASLRFSGALWKQKPAATKHCFGFPRRERRIGDSVAEAGWIEPVSAVKFPDKQGKNRESLRFWPVSDRRRPEKAFVCLINLRIFPTQWNS